MKGVYIMYIIRRLLFTAALGAASATGAFIATKVLRDWNEPHEIVKRKAFYKKCKNLKYRLSKRQES